MRIAGVIACVCISLMPSFASAQARNSAPDMPEVTASGRGEVRVPPDRAIVQVTVESRAATATAAASDNAGRVPRVMRAIESAGLSREQVATSGYGVTQDYVNERGGAQRPRGFIARTSIRADLRQITNVGKVIDAALAAGATEINAVQFMTSNLEEVRRRALAMAITDAQRDADAIARAAGGRLGRVIALTSGGAMTPFRSDVVLTSSLAGAASMNPTVIAPGELTITGVASGRWQFIPGER